MAGPHDALFKAIFADPEDAGGTLRAVLPPALASRLDWPTLRRLPESLPDPSDAEQRADLLFSVGIRGRELLLHVLFEHKSREDRWTALQAHGYALRIWQEHRRRHPGSSWLPPVISVVVHHGPRRWRGSTDLVDLFDLDPDLRTVLLPYLPRVQFVLDDLTGQSDAVLRARSVSSLTRLAIACLQRVGRGGEPEEILRGLRELFEAVLVEPSPGARLIAVLSYLAKVWDLEAEELRGIVHRELGPEAERAMTSTYDRLLNQGRAEGHAEGQAEGRAEGRAEILLEVFEGRFGPVPPAVADRVRCADVEQLREWARRVVTAPTLAAVFAER